MSLLELKQKVSRLSPAERRELGAYLVRLRNESPDWIARMEGRMHEMDEGHKVSLEELEARIRQQQGDAI